ncbi:MAG: AraC family transcriptional regulator, partial [Prevotella sp.]|nr:AraC family transcriptional regulator [Prevotella sp.]
KRNSMEIQNLKPRSGSDTLRLGDSDELVVMENFGSLPQGEIRLDNHGLIVICTDGMAQFDYDGQQIQLHKNDLYLYMSHSVVTNFMSSSDFNCRQIWFSRGELWNINKYGEVSLSDLPYLKRHPIMHLTEDDVKLLDDYFQLLCRRMRDSSPVLYSNIVRSLVSTMMLEILSMMRRQEPENTVTTDVHRQRLANEFMRLVEQSDGRIRKVDDFANQLNITPKYLSTLLKETMNRRPSEMIHFYTLKAIEHRLRYTDMTMQEIANDLNFANASFFGKYFKEHAGMTPLDFRKKYHR